ncbi:MULTISPECIES: ABC transporter ATP-binding protein [Eubacteriales]|uniref:ATP-binding cassette domain-containing protein n=1 Tax=Bittarella massiliensis (ex Durand et al. 2017) TaxID=1720313 RepID=A0AAQ1MFF4_9FIRM|nr:MULTISPECIES: ABC transporter ATP-binding protein [Eubacteriales]ERI99812.1 ABC transporter, ATP-binding protein [Clostridium sp. ATCC 29733]MZL69410.1 ATP-binding cassette domain-containing protein [Bittarella massiliensis (ex Durand et al. 2017)]MZL79048.1 ATP-binding cassette domain-containing protein [Bittarella massiliensis (ex Durand et al. 2017)]SHG46567.1 ATP-binding cassette, subfamily B [Bittarella massiliensis (ex Durand et al. 2017)]
MVRQLAPYTKKYRLYMILAPISVIFEVLLEIRIPYYMSKIVDVGINTGDMDYVLRTGGMMVLMAILGLCFGATSSRFASMAGMGFGSELRRGLFEKVQSFSFANVDKFSTASLITRLTTDVQTIQMAFMMTIRMLVRAPVMLVGATIMAVQINGELALVFLVAIPILASLLALIAVKAYPQFRKMLDRYDNLNASVQENLIAIRVVKAFARSEFEKGKFKNANDALTAAQRKAERILNWNMPVMQLTVYSCIVAILWFGGQKIVVGNMQTGELISFVSYVNQILMSLMMIANVFVNLVMSRASLQRISDVLAEEPDIQDGSGEAQAADGSIDFENVSFKYNKDASEKVLEGIDLHIASGQMVGIIGGTGSAKSTLVQLIPRLYDVSEGRILVGGRDVRDYKIAELRQAVGMVLQKNVLFSGTIRDNLKWGDGEASDEEIVAAAQAAQADDFVQSFPDGYDTDLGQGGVNVSGGQKQRLCIARALLKKPKILILDDSTSAVDTATDARIRQAFATDLAGTTKIIIAQRITSVCDCDQIIVMDGGKIAAVGTHDELMKTSEIYRDVYESQQKGVA